MNPKSEPLWNGEVRVVKMPPSDKIRAMMAILPPRIAAVIQREIDTGKRCAQCGDTLMMQAAYKPRRGACSCNVIDV